MKNKKTIENVTTRISPKLKKWFLEIKQRRIEDGGDKKKKSDREITIAMMKHSLMENLQGEIIYAENEKFEE